MATTYLQKLRATNRDVRLLLVSIVLFGLAFFGVHMVLLNLYLLRLGHGLKLVGSVFGVLGLMFAIGSLPAGVMGRRWGDRHMMILGMGICTVAAGLIPLAGTMPMAWQPGSCAARVSRIPAFWPCKPRRGQRHPRNRKKNRKKN